MKLFLFLFLILLSLQDFVLTYIIISGGGAELNPALNFLMEYSGIYSILVFKGMSLTLLAMVLKDINITWLWLFNILYGSVVTYQYIQVLEVLK